jgi:hypothetical protein
MSGFTFDVDAALASARSGTGDPATPATVATDARTNAELSQLSQLPQRANSSASMPQGLNVTARFGAGVRLQEGREGRWFCAAHRPQEAGTS